MLRADQNRGYGCKAGESLELSEPKTTDLQYQVRLEITNRIDNDYAFEPILWDVEIKQPTNYPPRDDIKIKNNL